MAAFSSKYNVRSISLPARSHPSTIKVEQELNKLKCSSFSNKDSICNALSGLGDLYKCIQDLLNSPMTQQALSQYQHEKWVDELIGGSVRYLDICNKIKDTVVLMRERVHELQSSLRRSLSSCIEGNIDVTSFTQSRKHMKKEMVKFITVLKHMEHKYGASSSSIADHHLSAVIKVLREANLTVISIFQSLALFFSVSPLLKAKKPNNKWSIVSQVMHKGRVTCDDGQHEKKMNELVERLEALDVCMESIENGLECLFKHLIHARVSLLNILSH